MTMEGHGGVSRRHSTGPGRAGKGETSWCGEQAQMTRRAWSRGESMTDQLSLFGEEAVVRHLGGGEARSRSAPTGERQALSASEGNRALALRYPALQH